MRTLRAGAMSFFILAAALAIFAQAPPGDIPKIDIEKYTLPNGLEVILSEDHRVPLVGVDLWYHVGPAHEAPGRTGFAHLFEHMMFQGSRHVESDAHFRLLAGAGATGINGTTDFDRTNYFETMPANQLEFALWIESDRMGYLLELVDQKSLSNQQDVVRNERRQSYENRPYGTVEEAMYQLLFPKGHPYHGVIIGSHADIQAVKLADVREFFRQYYAPNNATIAIAGDIDKAATKKLISQYFGSLKRGPAVPPVKVETPAISTERRSVVSDRVELPRVYMAWITPPFFKEGGPDADITAGILGQGRSSRLYKRLVYDKQLAQSVNAYQESAMLGSMFVVQATARPGRTAQELEAAIDEELERMRTESPGADEVDRVRNVGETRLFRGLQLVGGFGGVADQLNYWNHYVGTPDYLARDVTRRRNVTPDSVRRFVQTYLQNRSRVVVHGVPGTQVLAPEVPTAGAQAPTTEAQEGINADEPWRMTPPKAAGLLAVRVPVPQSFELANGLTVIALPQTGGMPVVSATLVVRSGSDANPADKPGLASFTAAMLDQGTATRNALQLAEDSAQIGATLSTNSSRDASTVAVTSLRRNFPAALALLADVSLRPGFPAEEVERIRAARLADLAQQRGNPTLIATNVMAMTLYGDAHPYGFSELGTAASNKSLSRDDLQAFWRRHFVPGNAALVVAGPITLPELRQAAAASLGSWPRGTAAPVQLGLPAFTAPRLVIVDRPGSPQTQVRVATFGLSRTSPDYIPVRVMNTIFGGMFASRINMNLREAHGYTYGANSTFQFARSGGPFSVQTGVRTDVTGPAVREMQLELKRMVDTRVTPGELTLAKDSIIQSLPAAFETNDRTVNALSSLFTFGLPLNYYANLAEQVSVVDAQAVQEAAKKYLVPERMVVIAVGDSSKIRQPLEAEVAPAQLRSPDGLVLSK